MVFNLILLLGPYGFFQLAPFTHFHHCEKSKVFEIFFWLKKTSDPGTNKLSSGFGVPGGNCFFKISQSTFFSAVVFDSL